MYVPNGRSLDHEQYQFKLDWLARLRAHLDAACDPNTPVVVCGDFNIAPTIATCGMRARCTAPPT